MKTKEELEKSFKVFMSKTDTDTYPETILEFFWSEISERDKALDKLNEGYVLLDTKAKENIQVYLNMIDDRDSKLSALEKENAEIKERVKELLNTNL